MADMLVRNVAANLKKDVEQLAKHSKRSLSDEIKHLIRLGLEREGNLGNRDAGDTPLDAMRMAFAGCQMSDVEHDKFSRVLEEARNAPEPEPFEF